jgi:hypothetical protein
MRRRLRPFVLPNPLEGAKPAQLAADEQRRRRAAEEMRRTIDLDAEERRSRLIDARGRRFDKLIERYRERGDQLVKVGSAAIWGAGLDLPEATIIRRFIEDVRYGHFPSPDTGFMRRSNKAQTLSWEEPGRRAVRDLIDFSSLRLFPAGQYPLRPSLMTVEGAATEMLAKRSILTRWFAAQVWPIPPQLQAVEKDVFVKGRRVPPDVLAWVRKEGARGCRPKPDTKESLKDCKIALQRTNVSRQNLRDACEHEFGTK